MTTDYTLAIRASLADGGSAAETQLTLLAANAGDSQLQLVVESLSAAEINVIVADADMSKPSVAHAFISPAQFLEAFDRLGSRWSRFDAVESMSDYAEIQRDVEDFLCPMILASEDPVRIKQMIVTLFGHELGAEAVLFSAIDRKDYRDFVLSPGSHGITRGTWQELLQVTLEYYPAGHEEVADLARAVFQDGERGTMRFATSFINGMHDEAKKYHSHQETVSDDFVDI